MLFILRFHHLPTQSMLTSSTNNVNSYGLGELRSSFKPLPLTADFDFPFLPTAPEVNVGSTCGDQFGKRTPRSFLEPTLMRGAEEKSISNQPKLSFDHSWGFAHIDCNSGQQVKKTLPMFA